MIVSGQAKTQTFSLNYFAESAVCAEILASGHAVIHQLLKSSVNTVLCRHACLLGNKSFIENGQKQHYTSTLKGFTVQLCPFSCQSA